ncbi:MAG: metal-dependent phosphohydrolase [Geminicoccaceae bacterium]
MVNFPAIIVDTLGQRLRAELLEQFPKADSDLQLALGTATRMTIERIARSDALYHNVEHTILVTLVGLEILRGRNMREGIDAEDWVHFVVALLCHDVGYVRGVCRDDTSSQFVIDEEGTKLEAPRGASDAWLTPYHVTRGKIFVTERCGAIGAVDPARIAKAIELTRFPVPQDGDHDDVTGEPGLVRAADLIGQMADPNYPKKHNALFYEFVETGTADILGYKNPADLSDGYPTFFWSCVEPYVGKAIELLEETQQGRTWVAQLYAHVFSIQHRRNRMGPQRAQTTAGGGETPALQKPPLG